jgi:hypothetical protein
MLHDFMLAEKRVRLWQRTGESYEHVLMKALGYAMFVKKYPQMEIETRVGQSLDTACLTHQAGVTVPAVRVATAH